jgi:hypothetical protein
MERGLGLLVADDQSFKDERVDYKSKIANNAGKRSA